MPTRELMTSLVETLDIQEFRSEIVRYALNSEVFYAFPLSYLISLLKKITQIAPHLSNSTNQSPSPLMQVNFTNPDDQDLRDLLKTIQIQLCMKFQEISPMTIKKLIIIHQTLPILNIQFLQLLLTTYNEMRSQGTAR